MPEVRCASRHETLLHHHARLLAEGREGVLGREWDHGRRPCRRCCGGRVEDDIACWGVAQLSRRASTHSLCSPVALIRGLGSPACALLFSLFRRLCSPVSLFGPACLRGWGNVHGGLRTAVPGSGGRQGLQSRLRRPYVDDSSRDPSVMAVGYGLMIPAGIARHGRSTMRPVIITRR